MMNGPDSTDKQEYEIYLLARQRAKDRGESTYALAVIEAVYAHLLSDFGFNEKSANNWILERAPFIAETVERISNAGDDTESSEAE